MDSEGQGPDAARGEVGNVGILRSQMIITLPCMLNTQYAQPFTPCDSNTDVLSECSLQGRDMQSLLP